MRTISSNLKLTV